MGLAEGRAKGDFSVLDFSLNFVILSKLRQAVQESRLAIPPFCGSGADKVTGSGFSDAEWLFHFRMGVGFVSCYTIPQIRRKSSDFFYFF